MPSAKALITCGLTTWTQTKTRSHVLEFASSCRQDKTREIKMYYASESSYYVETTTKLIAGGNSVLKSFPCNIFGLNSFRAICRPLWGRSDNIFCALKRHAEWFALLSPGVENNCLLSAAYLYLNVGEDEANIWKTVSHVKQPNYFETDQQRGCSNMLIRLKQCYHTFLLVGFKNYSRNPKLTQRNAKWQEGNTIRRSRKVRRKVRKKVTVE